MKTLEPGLLFENIKANETRLPVILLYLQKTDLPGKFDRENFFVPSAEHQTQRHVFRRLLHKPLIKGTKHV
jgi:hypothetical protein